MFKLLDKVCGYCSIIGAFLLIFMTFSIGYSILARQTGLTSPIWILQLNEYALLWITFLCTAWILAEDRHIAIQLLTDRLGTTGQYILSLIHNIVGAGLCAVFCWYGYLTTRDHLLRGVIDTQAIDVPKGYILAVIPLGFLLLFLQFFKRLITALKVGRTSVDG